MITRLNVTSIYVLDKEEALDFYVNKLGLEKGNDVRQGDYRWLTVRVPGNPETEVSLEQPGPPLHDEATAAQLRELITKGALGGLVFITDDARGLYETLQARGVTRSSLQSRRLSCRGRTTACPHMPRTARSSASFRQPRSSR